MGWIGAQEDGLDFDNLESISWSEKVEMDGILGGLRRVGVKGRIWGTYILFYKSVVVFMAINNSDTIINSFIEFDGFFYTMV